MRFIHVLTFEHVESLAGDHFSMVNRYRPARDFAEARGRSARRSRTFTTRCEDLFALPLGVKDYRKNGL